MVNQIFVMIDDLLFKYIKMGDRVKMKEINLEELKKLEIGIMDEIHKFCIENNIKYYLGYRHIDRCSQT